MKAIVFLMLAFMSKSLVADEKKAIPEKSSVPNYLKGATIMVVLKTGQTYQFSANDYAVVPREYVVSPPPSPQPVVIEKEKVVVEEKVIALPKNKNRLRLLVGSSLTKVDIVDEGNGSILVEKKRELYYGMGYERLLTDNWSLGLEAAKSRSLSFTLGYDF